MEYYSSSESQNIVLVRLKKFPIPRYEIDCDKKPIGPPPFFGAKQVSAFSIKICGHIFPISSTAVSARWHFSPTNSIALLVLGHFSLQVRRHFRFENTFPHLTILGHIFPRGSNGFTFFWVARSITRCSLHFKSPIE